MKPTFIVDQASITELTQQQGPQVKLEVKLPQKDSFCFISLLRTNIESISSVNKLVKHSRPALL